MDSCARFFPLVPIWVNGLLVLWVGPGLELKVGFQLQLVSFNSLCVFYTQHTVYHCKLGPRLAAVRLHGEFKANHDSLVRLYLKVKV